MRAAVATSAAAGAFALSAPPAQAVSNQVDSLADGPADGECVVDCTIRDALTLANGSADVDTITFLASLSGTIHLSSGVLVRTGNYDLTIDGPGASQLTISGDGDNNGSPNSRVLRISDDNTNDSGNVSIEGLTLTKGTAGGGTNRGGALYGFGSDSDVTLTNVTVSDSVAGGEGGGIYTNAELTLVNASVSGNESTGNDGGGVYADDDLTITNSSITGNTAAQSGGGAIGAKYLGIRDSVISGNDAGVIGGGVAIKYSSFSDPRRLIVDTTISGNNAAGSGAGIGISEMGPGARVRIVESTVTGNTGGPSSDGGGISVPLMYGRFELLNSTVSGNSAQVGGGVSFGEPGIPLTGDFGQIELNNSTIAKNSATGIGGGLYLGRYNTGSGYESGTVYLNSTLVGDNTAGGTAQDLDRANNTSGGGFDSAFSLIERKGDAPVIGSPNVLGVDPKLKPLADNGGPTMTHKFSTMSKAVDRGDSSRLDTDQRGRNRSVSLGVPNAQFGNGTDIGAVELQRSEIPNEKCAGKLATIIGDSKKIVGTNGRDIISGTAGKNIIRGKGGRDILCGRGGRDRLIGGPGRDRLIGGAGRDTLRQ
jgi:predicted outer membrane repeat protein